MGSPWRAGGVWFEFVVTRDHGNVSSILEPDLRRAKDVTRRVERDFDSAPVHFLTILHKQEICVSIDPETEKFLALDAAQVILGPITSMVRVCVSNDGPGHRP